MRDGKKAYGSVCDSHSQWGTKRKK